MPRWLAVRSGPGACGWCCPCRQRRRPSMQARGGRRTAAGALGTGRRTHGAGRAGRAGCGASSPCSLGARVLRAETAPLAALACWPARYTCKDAMNRNLWLLADLPGPVPHQQRHLHRHQRPGRAGAGAAGLDGDAAGDGLRGRRRAVHRAWSREHSSASAARCSFQLGLGGRARCPPCCAPMRPRGSNFWLLCFATVVAGYYNANASLYRFAAAELARAAGARKGRVAGDGRRPAGRGGRARTWPRARATCSAVPFAGAYLALAVVALLAHGACWRSSNSPRRRRAALRATAAGRLAKSCASRCSSWRPRPARWGSAS